MSIDTTSVANLGTLPKEFTVKTDQINFTLDDSANSHNEVNVDLACKEEFGFANDTITLHGEKIDSGYRFEIQHQSEVRVQLFRDGRMTLDFNEKTGQWSLKAFKSNGDDWAFCDAGAALDLLASSVTCYISLQTKHENLDPFIQTLVTSISSAKEQIAANALEYGLLEDTNNADCSAVRPERPALGDDGVLTWD